MKAQIQQHIEQLQLVLKTTMAVAAESDNGVTVTAAKVDGAIQVHIEHNPTLTANQVMYVGFDNLGPTA